MFMVPVMKVYRMIVGSYLKYILLGSFISDGFNSYCARSVWEINSKNKLYVRLAFLQQHRATAGN
jgi:hypothetical protein